MRGIQISVQLKIKLCDGIAFLSIHIKYSAFSDAITFYWAVKCFHRSCACRERQLKGSVNDLLADFLTCQHMVARQTNSSRTRHQHHPRGIEVAADWHFAFWYSYTAASEYLSTPQTDSSSLSLQLCFFPLFPLFLSLSVDVCKCV